VAGVFSASPGRAGFDRLGVLGQSLKSRAVTPEKVRAARLLAIGADVAQIVVFPLFAGGALSPWDDGLDLLVAAVLTRLLGWHWAFLPTFFAELVPGLDLVPTWTAAVFFATRGAHKPDAIDAEVVSGGRTPSGGSGPDPGRLPAPEQK
jgi:hypothetical protein